jgi:predicted branched-subunit amino acid permease
VEPLRHTVIRDSLGVSIAVGSYGVAFGAASVAAGLSVPQTALLSMLAFTGGTQFAVVGVVSGGGTLVAALSSGLLLGARNTLYAIRLAPLLRVRGWRRLLAAHGTIDETTAMAVARAEPPLARLAFWWTFAGVWMFWNIATIVGALGAQALGDPARFGLDAVIPAAFLALLAPRLRAGAIERRVAAAAAVIALVLIPFAPPGVPILASSAALLLAGVAPAQRRPGELSRAGRLGTRRGQDDPGGAP